jgi:hypothetical protein
VLVFVVIALTWVVFGRMYPKEAAMTNTAVAQRSSVIG